MMIKRPSLTLGMIGLMFPAGLLAMAPSPGRAVEAAATPYVMPRSSVRTLRSAANEQYVIYVAWPREPPPPKGYPILYLLDGTETFAFAAEFKNRLGEYSGMQPGIVVGIGYPGVSRREFDYTPPTPKGPWMPERMRKTGGADLFLAFLAGTVIPSVEKDFKVDAGRRTIAGYSLGGLFVLHAFLSRPELFRTYVAASPSIWFGDKRVLASMPGLARRLKAAGPTRRLFLNAGEFEQSAPPGREMDPEWLKIAELSRRARMIDNARDLAQRLQGGLARVQFKIVPGETHATGNFQAVREALLDAFVN